MKKSFFAKERKRQKIHSFVLGRQIKDAGKIAKLHVKSIFTLFEQKLF